MLGSGQTQNVTVASLCEQKKTKVVPGSLFQSLLEMFLFIVKRKEASSTCLKMADGVTAALLPVLDLLTHSPQTLVNGPSSELETCPSLRRQCCCLLPRAV